MRPFDPSNHIIKTRISGIPCEVWVGYLPPTPDIPPAFSHGGLPGDPEEIEVKEVYDRKGYRAKWLERKLEDQSLEEWENWERELIQECEKQRRNGREYD